MEMDDPKGTETIRLGVVGLGRAAALTLPSLIAHPRIEVTAAADPNPTARARFESELRGDAYKNITDLCRRASIDAVYIATPHQCHVDDALTAADFGKHMIIEKPMALSVADCERVIDAANRAKVTVLVGHSHAFSPAVRKMREIIASGEFGAVRMIVNIVYSDFIYRPRRLEELDSRLGGGIVYNQVPHQIDIARTVAGSPLQSVRAVFGSWDDSRPTDGALSALLHFKNGAVATLVYNGYDRFDSDELHYWISADGKKKKPAHGNTLHALAHRGGVNEVLQKGQRGFAGRGLPNKPVEPPHQPHFGFLLVSCERADLKPSADGVTIYDANGRRDVELPQGRAFPNRDSVADDFYDALVYGRRPMQNGQWGLQTVASTAALIESSDRGQEIHLESLDKYERVGSASDFANDKA